MKLSLSNIAWNPKDDLEVLRILKNYNISYIDIAPSLFQDIEKNFFLSEFLNLKDFWNSKSIEFSSMQSLLFGLGDFSIFDKKKHKILIDRLKKTFEIAEVLNIKNLIFGSPKNRNFIHNEKEKNLIIAKEFFCNVSNLMNNFNCVLSIEPNPKIYGSDFIINTIECVDFVKDMNRKNLKVHIDIGSSKINNENLENIFKKNADLINSIHISEPNLQIIHDKEYHLICSELIKKYLPNTVLSIEIAEKNIINLQELEKNIALIKEIYN